MNEVARDLEDPFIYDPNELPLPRMQYCFNERLLQNAAAHFQLPESGAALGEVYIPTRTGATSLFYAPVSPRASRGTCMRRYILFLFCLLFVGEKTGFTCT
jgi:hypothetical protein